MNTEWLIARRISLGGKLSFSRFIVTIAIIATVLSMSVMVTAVCMVHGFTTQIEEKVFGFWGHIQVRNFQNNNSYEEYPITQDAKMISRLRKLPEIQSVNPYITKAGIIRTKNALEGIALKGVDHQYNWTFLSRFMKAGSVPKITPDSTSRDIIISSSTARRLKASVGDKMIVYFVGKENTQPLGKTFFISGIYHTGLEEYDARFAIMDLKMLQNVNQWEPSQVGGYEISVKDISKIDTLASKIYYQYLGNELYAETIREAQPNIFDWLQLQVRTEIFALILMLMVAILNMVSALMILILDRTHMIGVLKALGAHNSSIRKIFLYNSFIIIALGLVFGNGLGLLFCYLQDTFGFIKLDEASYYFTTAPVGFPWLQILLINVITIAVNLLVLLIPSAIISRISPVKAIRFD